MQKPGHQDSFWLLSQKPVKSLSLDLVNFTSTWQGNGMYHSVSVILICSLGFFFVQVPAKMNVGKEPVLPQVFLSVVGWEHLMSPCYFVQLHRQAFRSIKNSLLQKICKAGEVLGSDQQ